MMSAAAGVVLDPGINAGSPGCSLTLHAGLQGRRNSAWQAGWLPLPPCERSSGRPAHRCRWIP
jgi:hypothetical protein